MCAHLKEPIEFSESYVNSIISSFKSEKLIYSTGFLIDIHKELLQKVASKAAECNIPFAFSLADQIYVQLNITEIDEVLKNTDFVFANQ